MATDDTEELPPDAIHENDVIRHPETGEWVTVRAITEGSLGSRGQQGTTKSAVYYFLYTDSSEGVLSIVDIPGEKPALRRPVNPVIVRKPRE